MGKLTAMQELIEEIQEMQNDNFISDIEYIKEKAISKQEKERQDIIDAVKHGEYFHNCIDYSPENYYNETFKK